MLPGPGTVTSEPESETWFRLPGSDNANTDPRPLFSAGGQDSPACLPSVCSPGRPPRRPYTPTELG
jgi:hypothetical protein